MKEWLKETKEEHIIKDGGEENLKGPESTACHCHAKIVFSGTPFRRLVHQRPCHAKPDNRHTMERFLISAMKWKTSALLALGNGLKKLEKQESTFLRGNTILRTQP
jgi:hypothetical protein